MRVRKIMFSFSLLLSLASIVYSHGFFIKTKVQTSYVRSEPMIGSSIIKQYDFGTILEATQKLNNWYEVIIIDNNIRTTGFILADVVEILYASDKDLVDITSPNIQRSKEDVQSGFSTEITIAGGLSDPNAEVGIALDISKNFQLNFAAGYRFTLQNQNIWEDEIAIQPLFRGNLLFWAKIL